MEVYLANQMRILKIAQVIAFHKSKLKILSKFCKCTELEVPGSTPRNYPALCMLFRRPFGGLSPCFLVGMLAKGVY